MRDHGALYQGENAFMPLPFQTEYFMGATKANAHIPPGHCLLGALEMLKSKYQGEENAQVPLPFQKQILQ